MPDKCDREFDCASCEHKDNCSAQNNVDFSYHLNDYSSIKKIIAIMSGKGGVGKSFVSSLIASTLSKNGFEVGILDADITGPSIPKSLGINNKAQGSEIGILPAISKTGIKVMSINLLLEDDTAPVVWRGPVIASAIKQFYEDTVWGDLDYLIVDMPPGTGDVPLTVFQSIPVDGIVVVTSPQELVSMIVKKAVNMAGLMDKPIIGIVENLSYFHCPDNNKNYNIFGDSKIDSIAKDNNINALAKLPIDPTFASLQDKGLIEDLDTKEINPIIEEIIKL